ncbi:MAG TPA: SDR family oxidoreductase [Jiangellaceae bacterium]
MTGLLDDPGSDRVHRGLGKATAFDPERSRTAMPIVVTGATGHLGRLVVEELLARGVPSNEVVATGRAIDKIKDLAGRGVRAEAIDYDEPDTLRRAFAGADKVLLISGTEVGRRVVQHRNVIAAAAEAGVGLLAYTSIANADRSTMRMAGDHRATEEALAVAALPVTILRHSWYLENYTGQLPVFLQHGAILGSAGEGRVSAATRADYAAAAATVLTSDGHAGRAYELGGDSAFSMAELAATITELSGREVMYRDLAEQEYAAALTAAGLPEPYAAALADSDRGLARGELLVGNRDLSRLAGRPTTSMPEAVASALASM